jgi:two-component system, NtrC family, sensor kinase
MSGIPVSAAAMASTDGGEPQRSIREVEALRTIIERLRSRMAHQDRLASLGSLVAGIVHEINNPLSCVVGTLDIMKRILGEDAATADDCRTKELCELVIDCEGAIDRIRQLTLSLKGIGRDGSRDDLVFDPNRAIRDVVKLFAIAKRHQCHVELELAPLPAVRGSPARLGQVILNLLQNGLDAGGQHPRLEVRAELTQGGVRISIADRGLGIPPEIAPRIFEPFFTSKSIDTGMGLGLSICRELVTEMGGTIDFETSPRGTTFHVDLPACGPTADPLPVGGG